MSVMIRRLLYRNNKRKMYTNKRTKKIEYKNEQIDGNKDDFVIRKRTIVDDFYYKNCIHCDEKQCKVKKFYQGIC